MVTTNPPLRVGQKLEPRGDRKIGTCEIIGFVIAGSGLVWAVRNTIGDELVLDLSMIYKMFKFEGQTD